MNDLPTIDPALGAREGTIDFRGYRVWYAVVGEEEEVHELRSSMRDDAVQSKLVRKDGVLSALRRVAS